MSMIMETLLPQNPAPNPFANFGNSLIGRVPEPIYDEKPFVVSSKPHSPTVLSFLRQFGFPKEGIIVPDNIS